MRIRRHVQVVLCNFFIVLGHGQYAFIYQYFHKKAALNIQGGLFRNKSICQTTLYFLNFIRRFLSSFRYLPQNHSSSKRPAPNGFWQLYKAVFFLQGILTPRLCASYRLFLLLQAHGLTNSAHSSIVRDEIIRMLTKFPEGVTLYENAVPSDTPESLSCPAQSGPPVDGRNRPFARPAQNSEPPCLP